MPDAVFQLFVTGEHAKYPISYLLRINWYHVELLMLFISTFMEKGVSGYPYHLPVNGSNDHILQVISQGLFTILCFKACLSVFDTFSGNTRQDLKKEPVIIVQM